MRRRPRLLLASLAVLALSAPSAAIAASDGGPVRSRADAEAINIDVAGQGAQGTGPVEATYDGSGETVTGQTPSPPQPAQDVFKLGVLTQQATAGDGTAAACAGVAGTGGGIIQIGQGSCLRPGKTVNGSLSDFDPGQLGLEPPEGFELPEQLPGGLPLPPELDPAQVLAQVRAAIEQAGASTDLDLTMQFDAIEGRCEIDGGAPTGSASLANARIVGTAGGRTVTLAGFEDNPAPNTRVVTGLSAVLYDLLMAFERNFQTSLDGQLSAVGAQLLAPVRKQLVKGVRGNLEQQLKPLEDNVLRVVLNEQTRPTPDSIRVTALRAEVLPVARDQLGASLVDLRIGAVGCGPAERAAADASEPRDPGPATPQQPRLPTAVSAGVAGEPQGGPGLAAYAALALGGAAAGAAGWSAWRRRTALRG